MDSRSGFSACSKCFAHSLVLYDNATLESLSGRTSCERPTCDPVWELVEGATDLADFDRGLSMPSSSNATIFGSWRGLFADVRFDKPNTGFGEVLIVSDCRTPDGNVGSTEVLLV